MKHVIALGFLFLFISSAAASSIQSRVVFENQIEQKISALIQRVDTLAMVQVQIKLRKINTELPVVGFGGSVTPIESDGQLGSMSIDNVSVRVVTQIDEVPEWIRSEIDKTLKSYDFKYAINYEKAAGQITDDRLKFADSAVRSINQVKWATWGLLLALMVFLTLVASSIRGVAERLEKSLAKVIEEKVVPAFQTMGGGGRSSRSDREPKESSPQASQASMNSGGGSPSDKGLEDYPVDALLTLLSDCYWTKQDGYAHHLWKLMSQAQREKVLKASILDPAYFSFIRQSVPAAFDYHNDPSYLSAPTEFRAADQDELLAWVRKNPSHYHRLTPMRWDGLNLSLEERLKFRDVKPNTGADWPKLFKASKPRELPVRLQLKSLRPEDEMYLSQNYQNVPKDLRASLRSLVWLAMAPLEDRRRALADLDAQQLAEAWTGPESVLAQLEEALPAKKREMLAHFRQSISPDRSSDAFAYLVDSGLSLTKGSEERQEAA